jgi:AraC-like DNA-binding protein
MPIRRGRSKIWRSGRTRGPHTCMHCGTLLDPAQLPVGDESTKLLTCHDALYSDSLVRFARQCQVVAGACVPPTDAVDVLCTAWLALRSFPDEIPSASIPYATAIVVVLARHVLRRDWSNRLSIASVGHVASPRNHINRAFDLLFESHTCVNVSLTGIAYELRVSPSHLCRTMRNMTRDGFVTHLSGLRVLTAASLLNNVDFKIKEVATRSGYHHTGELDRDFRKWFHVSPRQFRSALNKQHCCVL